MSERNRELLNLFVVGTLTAIGFASVYIARQSAEMYFPGPAALFPSGAAGGRPVAEKRRPPACSRTHPREGASR